MSFISHYRSFTSLKCHTGLSIYDCNVMYLTFKLCLGNVVTYAYVTDHWTLTLRSSQERSSGYGAARPTAGPQQSQR